MRPDLVEVSWDGNKAQWVIRIVNGEEVIRRHNNEPKSADDQTLRAAALKTVQDEGYEADIASISVKR
jgi:hypothetical protein